MVGILFHDLSINGKQKPLAKYFRHRFFVSCIHTLKCYKLQVHFRNFSYTTMIQMPSFNHNEDVTCEMKNVVPKLQRSLLLLKRRVVLMGNCIVPRRKIPKYHELPPCSESQRRETSTFFINVNFVKQTFQVITLYCDTKTVNMAFLPRQQVLSLTISLTKIMIPILTRSRAPFKITSELLNLKVPVTKSSFMRWTLELGKNAWEAWSLLQRLKMCRQSESSFIKKMEDSDVFTLTKTKPCWIESNLWAPGTFWQN